MREQEGRERLRTISQDLWIGHGYELLRSALIGLTDLQPTGSYRTYPKHGAKEAPEGGNSNED